VERGGGKERLLRGEEDETKHSLSLSLCLSLHTYEASIMKLTKHWKRGEEGGMGGRKDGM
jgi:hypothetical protein